MWNALKRHLRELDEQGRARFARLASDEERRTATASNVGIGAATGFALLSSKYFVLYAILTIILQSDRLGDPQLWLHIYYVSLLFGAAQGAPLGGIVAWSLSLLWQGKRHKAALVGLIGGCAVLGGMGLFQAQYYDPSFPLGMFVFWALLLFSPGYIVAACVTVWGANLLSKE